MSKSSENVLDFANRACRDLPYGWNLSLEMEQGAGYFELHDPDGNDIDLEEYGSVDHSLVRNGLQAIQYAVAASDTGKGSDGK